MPGGAGHNRGNSVQNRATPEIFVAATLRRLEIPEFVFDFAAEADNTVARCYWDKEVDSLKQPPEEWLGMVSQPYMNTPGWGWLNPEFDDIHPWAEACVALRGLGGQVALLVPAAVGSIWWREFVHGVAQVLLLNGRIPFDPENPDWGFPKDLALCLYSPAYEPQYDLWRWWDDVPAEMQTVHKQRAAESRARKAAAKKAKAGGTVVRTEEDRDAEVQVP